MDPLSIPLRELISKRPSVGAGLKGPQVLIVGGGVIGWAVAYHVIRMQPSAIVAVFEELTSCGMRSTGRAAGGVRAQFATAPNIQFSQFSKKQFERFPEDHGCDISFKQRGYLFVTATDSGRAHLEQAVALQNENGVDSRLLSPDGVADIAPYIRCDDLVAGSYCADDGYLDPFSVCAAYERSAKALGAHAAYSSVVTCASAGYCDVLDASQKVTTRVCADAVIVATGHLTPRLLGPSFPLKPELHYLALSEPIQGIPKATPMIVDLDTSFHFRSEGEGFLFGFNSKNVAQSESAPTVDPPFDDRFLEELATPGLHRLPPLINATFDSRKCWAGYYAETPDHHALLGPWNGLILATGFGGHGIMHSPAAGQAAAELALTGTCSTFDLRPLNPSRFSAGDPVVEQFVI